MNTRRKTKITLALLPIGLVTLTALSGCAASNGGQLTFATPEKAALALAEVSDSGDATKRNELFGASAAEVLDSGDEVADAEDRTRTSDEIQQKVAFEDRDAKTKVLLLGDDAWPFPIPLVKERKGWRFDTVAGSEEVTNRRIGGNELLTLATLHAVVDAQREYFKGRHEGRTKAYAKRTISQPGKQDGLFWETAEGKPESPLGPLLADASVEGYEFESGKSEPYHGYYFRMLHAQGASAPGGAKSYLDDKGAMTKGFAMVAWPAKYGNSGVMTFLVGDRGIVFQSDLGAETEKAAAAITVFNPDLSWSPTGD